MTTLRTIAAVSVACVLSLAVLVSPAAATGAAVGGAGSEYFLAGTTTTVFTYGDPGDGVYVGDWDGDGDDTLALRRGNAFSNTFYVRNSATSGLADVVFDYGDVRDEVLVGDWDGNGTDTFAVRRGNSFFVRNSTTTGTADVVFSYGDRGDAVLVGDWDGNGTDTLSVRRGGQYFVKNDLRSGAAERTFNYGDPGDTVLVGRWAAGQVGDALGVRRGGLYHLRTSLTSGPATTVVGFGNPGDTSMVGDWDGDGIDTLGVRRVQAAGAVPRYGDGSWGVGYQMPAGTYRSSAAPGSACRWERASSFGGPGRDVIASGSLTPEIVTIDPEDRAFHSRGCGDWYPVASTYPSAPQQTFGDGTFEVGRHIATGTYRAGGGQNCVYGQVSSFRAPGYLSSGSGQAGLQVTIQPGSVGFTSSGCGTWTQ